MLSSQHILNNKVSIAICLTLELAREIDISIGDIRRNSDRVVLIELRLDIVLTTPFKVEYNLIRVAKLIVMEVESGLRLCCKLDNQTIVILSRLTLCQLIVCAQSKLQTIYLLLRHTLDTHLNSGARATRAIILYRINIYTRKGITLDGLKARHIDKYRLRHLCRGCQSHCRNKQKCKKSSHII